MGVHLRLGPRVARVHVGSRGIGVSSGIGPFSAYAGTGRRSRASAGSGGAGITFLFVTLIALVIVYWWVVLIALGVVVLIVAAVRLTRRISAERRAAAQAAGVRLALPASTAPASAAQLPAGPSAQWMPQEPRPLSAPLAVPRTDWVPAPAAALVPHPQSGVAVPSVAAPLRQWTGQTPGPTAHPLADGTAQWTKQPVVPVSASATHPARRTPQANHGEGLAADVRVRTAQTDAARRAQEAQRRAAWRAEYGEPFVAPRRLLPVSVVLWVLGFFLLLLGADIVEGQYVTLSIAALSMAAATIAWGVYLWRGIPSRRAAALEDLTKSERRTFAAARRSRAWALVVWLIAIPAMTAIVGVIKPGRTGSVGIYVSACFVILGLALAGAGAYLWRGLIVTRARLKELHDADQALLAAGHDPCGATLTALATPSA